MVILLRIDAAGACSKRWKVVCPWLVRSRGGPLTANRETGAETRTLCEVFGREVNAVSAHRLSAGKQTGIDVFRLPTAPRASHGRGPLYI
jgi:hypothetical protein